MYYDRLSRRYILELACSEKTNYLHWLILGWETENLRLALQYFKKALELKPGDPVVLDSIASIYEKLSPVARSATKNKLIARDAEPAPAVREENQEIRYQLRKIWKDRIITSQGKLLNFIPNPVSRFWERIATHPGVPYSLYLAGLTLAEYLTAMSSPQVGLVLHSLLLLALFIQAAFSTRINNYRFYLVLTLAPLVRLMSLSMPLLQFKFMNWYMIIGLPLLLAGFMAMHLAGYTPKQINMGWGREWWLQALVALTGLGLGYLEYLILEPVPLTDTFSWQQFWYPALILLVFTGFLEEFIFRGILQRAASQRLGKSGLVFTATIFAVLHIGYQSLLDVLFVFMVGLFFSLVVQRTHSIWGVTIAHGLTNIMLFLVVPFLINGVPIL